MYTDYVNIICNFYFILTGLTVLTVLILRQAKQSRRQFLKMSETEMEQYSTRFLQHFNINKWKTIILVN